MASISGLPGWPSSGSVPRFQPGAGQSPPAEQPEAVDVLHQQGDIPGHQMGLQLTVRNLQRSGHGGHQQLSLNGLMPALSRRNPGAMQAHWYRQRNGGVILVVGGWCLGR